MDATTEIFEINDKLQIKFNDRIVSLPRDVQQKIDSYWEELIASGKKFKRGEVFTVTCVNAAQGSLKIVVEKTDYAHYLYSQNIGELGDHAVRIIHPATVVLSADRKIIFGKMGEHTARKGIFQLCGGGLETKDLVGDVFDLTRVAKRELWEELGIMTNEDADPFSKRYFVSNDIEHKITIAFILRLKIPVTVFKANYAAFSTTLTSRGEQTEFDSLIMLALNNSEMSDFLKQHDAQIQVNLKPFLRGQVPLE